MQAKKSSTVFMHLDMIWLIAVIFTPFAVGIAYADLPATILKIKPSIVSIGTVQKTRRPPSTFRGTGFAVGDGRLVVTNAHVLPDVLDSENHEYLAVFTDDEQTSNARQVTRVALDVDHDLAILRIEGQPLPPMALGDSTRVLEGEEYVFTGFPIGTILGHIPATHHSIISAITPIVLPAQSSGRLSPQMIKRLRSPYNVFQLDATAYPGNSGSPLYNPDTGVVIGVINMVFVKETKEAVLEKPSGISYAIPVQYVKRLLEQVK